MVLNLEMNLASSVSMDQSGNVAMPPTINGLNEPRGNRQLSRFGEPRDEAHDWNGDEFLREFLHHVDDAEFSRHLRDNRFQHPG